jgi:hypothetical protein
MDFGKLPLNVSAKTVEEILEVGKKEGEEFFFACADGSRVLVVSNIRIALVSINAKKIYLDWYPSAVNELFMNSGKMILYGSNSSNTFRFHKNDAEKLRKSVIQLGMNPVDKEGKKSLKKDLKERVATAKAENVVLAEVRGFGINDWGLILYEDSIQIEGRYRIIDVHTVAEVVSNGQVQVTTRPTLTRMALLSPIPGSALLPGLALAKSKTHDTRITEIIVTSLTWQATARIKPGDASKATAIANRINAIANSLVVVEATASPTVVQRITQQNTEDGLSAELGKLSELLKSGALSEEEFKAAKAKVLGL